MDHEYIVDPDFRNFAILTKLRQYRNLKWDNMLRAGSNFKGFTADTDTCSLNNKKEYLWYRNEVFSLKKRMICSPENF